MIITITAIIPIVGNCSDTVLIPDETLPNVARVDASVVVALNFEIVKTLAPATIPATASIKNK
jgi:hypothetical protein